MDITDYISTAEAAEMSGYNRRSISMLCKQGKITGAIYKAGKWFIPRISMLMYGKKKNKAD